MPTSVASRKRSKEKSGQANTYLATLVSSLKRSMLTVFFFSFCLNLLALAVPIYLLQIYSKVLPSQNSDTLVVLTVIALVAVFTFGALDSIRRTLLNKLGVKFDIDLSEHLLGSSINRSLRKPDTSVNVMRDLSRLREFLSSSAIIALLDVPWTPMFIFILYMLHPTLGMVATAGVFALLMLAFFNEYRTRDGVKKAGRRSREMMDTARASIRNPDVIQSMGMQTGVLTNWRSSNASYLSETYDTDRSSKFLQAVSKLVRLTLQVAIIFTAAWLILQGELTAGATIVSILLFRRAISPVEQSIRSWKGVIKARSAYANVNEYLNHAPSLMQIRDMPPPTHDLIADKIGYRRTRSEKPVFHNVRMTVGRGRITTIAGPTGAGKSTLLQALSGALAPDSGEVSIGGFDLQHWSPEQLGPWFGYLPQSAGLLPGSIRDNISRFSEHSIEDAINAAKLSGAHSLIQQLPDNYDFVINNEGTNLSGGQLQKIGLARAFFGFPRYIFLDEPDANLDAEGRQILRKALKYLKQNHSAIVVTTHRRSIEHMADENYLLHAGKITKANRKPRIVSDIKLVEDSKPVKISNSL